MGRIVSSIPSASSPFKSRTDPPWPEKWKKRLVWRRRARGGRSGRECVSEYFKNPFICASILI